jgi:3-oxoacyl-[acyl-carrier protein] reductase
MIDLSGKRALVTGGTRGIGLAVARALNQAGASVALGYHSNEAAARRVRDELPEALTIRADLTSEPEAERMFDECSTALGGLDIVVANAGIWRRAAVDTMTYEAWRQTVAANQDSLFFTCRGAARLLKANRGGKLVIIASTAGQRGEAYYSHYAATKGAAIAMTRSLAAELGPHDINVNCVAPGWVHTEMTRNVFADKAYLAEVEAAIPLRRIAEPEDVAGPVLFLCSDLARHVQGAVINVNGGSVLC